jgi:hypothetical protein
MTDVMRFFWQPLPVHAVALKDISVCGLCVVYTPAMGGRETTHRPFPPLFLGDVFGLLSGVVSWIVMVLSFRLLA